ncbi:hypothetical protein [Catelliglobosispora koreensis]|uniref:hypothetical protein n=1 Tax=Catelliglobosispora koreensis TaxID=129052 RepID=UPI0012FA3AE9|nr:hypothetical protein [Catelliglobosispora koreensis]
MNQGVDDRAGRSAFRRRLRFRTLDWPRWLAVVAVCLAGVLILAPFNDDAAAATGEEFPAALQSWTPAQPLGSSWAAAGNGKDTIASLCAGAWRSWRRTDGVVFGLKAYRCSPAQLATLSDILNRLRQTMPARWRQIPAALSGAADIVVQDSEKRHTRYWIQDGWAMAVVTECPIDRTGLTACYGLSTIVVRHIANALNGEPTPAPAPLVGFDGDPVRFSAPCCAKSEGDETKRAAYEVLHLWRPGSLVPQQEWIARPVPFIWADTDRADWAGCMSSSLGWSSPQVSLLFVQWWTCQDDNDVDEIMRRIAVAPAGPANGVPTGGVIMPGTDFALPLGIAGDGHVRVWGQQKLLIVVGAQCGELSAVDCAALSRSAVVDIGRRLGGRVVTPRPAEWFWLICGLSILVALTANVVVDAYIRRRLSAWYLVESGHPHWHDISTDTYGAKLMNRYGQASAAVAVAGLGMAVAGTLGFAKLVAISLGWSAVLAAVGGVLLVGGFGSHRRVRPPVTWKVRARMDRVSLTPRRARGIAMSCVAVILGFVLCAVWMSSVWVYTGGGPASFRATQIEQWLGERLPAAASLPLMWLVDLFAWVQMAGIPAIALLPIGPTVAILGVRWGRRTGAIRLEERLEIDDRPPVLLLRDFDDDNIYTPPSRVARAGLLASVFYPLSLDPPQPFVQLLARQLSVLGPVVAVAPGRTLAPIGPSVTSYADSDWVEHVTALAQRARAVVFLGTPEKIGDGLRTELEIVADERKIGHQRVMIVVPPDLPKHSLLRRRTWQPTKPRLMAAWHRFRIEASRHRPLFTALAQDWIPEGVQVLVHHPTEGWHAWGATTKDDWSYATALAEAAHYVSNAWPEQPESKALPSSDPS